MQTNPPKESSNRRPLRLMNKIYLAKLNEKVELNKQVETPSKNKETRKSTSKNISKSKEQISSKISSKIAEKRGVSSPSKGVTDVRSENKVENPAKEVAKNRPFTLPPGIFR